MGWAKADRKQNYRNQRVSFDRQLALYMISLNLQAYISRAFESNSISVRIFYLLMKYMNYLKLLKVSCLSRQVFSVFHYPTAYCSGYSTAEDCGCSKAVISKDRQYISENGCLSIYQSKGHQDRVVFMCGDMLQMCRSYEKLMQTMLPDRE